MRPRFLLAATAALLPLTMAAQPRPAAGVTIERLDPALDALVPRDAKVEQLADGFDWVEGPVWRKAGGYLLFNDIPRNTMWQYKDGAGVSVFLRPAGLASGTALGREIGSNGTALDPRGNVVMADHGNRLIARLDETGFTKATLADRYHGRRFNSPNDLVFRANGDLFFTDPPYGLAGLNDDPAKELSFNGVYRLTADGTLSLVVRDLTFPNGIAISPDDRTLYVAVSDAARAVWMAYDLAPDGSVSRGRVFFDATPLSKQGKPGLPDGMKVDRNGNLFATGPGGVLIFSPAGKHLGTIVTGQPTANCAFGDDGSTLYITANHALLRVRLGTKGLGY